MLDVLVIGGGPVGTFLGARLLQAGLDVRVCERRTAPLIHSRAIGIHPPALRAFEPLGVEQAIINAAVKIRRGLVVGESGVLGELNMAGAGRDYPFILTLPQAETERLLQEKLLDLSPEALRRGCEISRVTDLGPCCEVRAVQDGQTQTVQARYVVAADGWRSRTRRAAGVAFTGGPYPDAYLMGDFPDTTPFGDQAVIFLRTGGVVESFPLPGHKRRWVVHLGTALADAGAGEPKPAHLTHIIRERTGLPVPASECQMLSTFGVQHYRAGRMVQGRVIFIGDAAHVVSPIGGQGMTLGWQDAQELVPLLVQACSVQQSAQSQPERAPRQWRAFERRRLYASAVATRQAELNMAAGRPARTPLTQPLREALLSQLLRPAAQPLLAAAFTMRWL